MGLAPVSVTKYPAHHLSGGRQGKFVEEFNPAGVFMGRKPCFYKITDFFFQNFCFFKAGIETNEGFYQFSPQFIGNPNCRSQCNGRVFE